MSNLTTDFDFIIPRFLEKDPSVQGWFSKKNSQYHSDNAIPGLNLGFNTPEGKQVVAENRLQLLSQLGLDPEWVAYADQVHSNRIRVVTQGGTYPSTDGLITQIPGLTLGIQVADCAAVLLWDSQHKLIAALHAGWRGVSANIVPDGVEKMITLGADPQVMKAFISPCISLDNFEVGKEVAEQFPDAFVDYESFEKPHLNLKGFIYNQLAETGLPQQNIEIGEGCTIEQADQYYSYRREGNQSGRMMGLIQIKEQ